MRHEPKYTSNDFFSKMVSIILGSSCHEGVCLSKFSNMFALSLLFDSIKNRVWCHDCELAIGSAGVLAGL